MADGSAVVAVGGVGTINTVAQAAHAASCAMGVIPEGTFNYFARERGMPTDSAEALRWLLDARPEPAQVSAINERLFRPFGSLTLAFRGAAERRPPQRPDGWSLLAIHVPPAFPNPREREHRRTGEPGADTEAA